MGLRKSIPNLITSMNLLSGTMGVILVFQGKIGMAFGFMVLAAIFDFLDGFAARILKAYSPIGKELDSLSDLVSFGLLPSLMMVKTMWMHSVVGAVSIVPLFLVVMSAFRLAKFNVDDRQGENFIGLPTPASAMVCGSLCTFIFAFPESRIAALAGGWWLIPLIAVILGLLLVSEIPFFGMKAGAGHKLMDAKRIVFICLGVAAIVLAFILKYKLSFAILAFFTLYILENLFLAPFKRGPRQDQNQ